MHGALSAVVDEDHGFADGVADLGDGLAMDSSIANRLFQYQLTGRGIARTLALRRLAWVAWSFVCGVVVGLLNFLYQW